MKNQINKYLPIGIVIIIGFFAARHLLLSGFVPTHDGEYHIIRFWQFDKVFRTGNFIPRWAPDLDFSRGVPIFAFFYPLPNYIAEVFILMGFSYVKSLHLVLASSLIISGITFYLWMRTLFKARPSTVGAIFYLLAPYHLVDIFVRGSVGEVWALALAPLVLCLTTKMIQSKQETKQKFQIYNSIALLFLLTSHNILGPLFFLFGLLYGIVILTPGDLLRKTPGVLISYIIGLMLSAFFWIPIIFEKAYVVGLDLVNYKDHFPQFYQLLIPSWGTGFSGLNLTADQMSFQIGIAHILVILGALSLYIFKKRRNLMLNFFLAVFFTAIFFMLNLSDFLWNRLTFMHYFQYPWRLLSLVIISASFLSCALAESFKKLAALLIIIALLFYLPYTKPVVYPARADSFYLENPTWTKGTATMGNSFRAINKKKIIEIESSLIRKSANSISLMAVIILIVLSKSKWTDKKLQA